MEEFWIELVFFSLLKTFGTSWWYQRHGITSTADAIRILACSPPLSTFTWHGHDKSSLSHGKRRTGTRESACWPTSLASVFHAKNRHMPFTTFPHEARQFTQTSKSRYVARATLWCISFIYRPSSKKFLFTSFSYVLIRLALPATLAKKGVSGENILKNLMVPAFSSLQSFSQRLKNKEEQAEIYGQTGAHSLRIRAGIRNKKILKLTAFAEPLQFKTCYKRAHVESTRWIVVSSGTL